MERHVMDERVATEESVQAQTLSTPDTELRLSGSNEFSTERGVAEGTLARWPFLGYMACWATLIVVTLGTLWGAKGARVPGDDPIYPALLLAAVTLVALGPLLSVLVWFVAWSVAPSGARGGLLTAALVRGAAATAGGIVSWWVALGVIDAVRLGVLG